MKPHLAPLLLLLVAGSAAAKPVDLVTGDLAALSGDFTPGRLGSKSPAVIVLDDLRDKADPAACKAVAARLSAAGCAVLTFDFRGHGGSRKVAPGFWADPFNRRMVKASSGGRPDDEIAFADFRPGYLPALVNDVAAARAFLESRNDAGECNAGELYLVGFGEGAAVGTLWLGSEWRRFRAYGPFSGRLAAEPEGKAVAGCAWVGLSPTLDRKSVPVAEAAALAGGKEGSVFFGLITPEGDAKASRVASDWVRRLNDPGSRTTAVVTKAVAAPEGVEFAAAPAVADAVAKLVADMRKATDDVPWAARAFVERRYVWAGPGGGVVLAKAEGEEATRPAPAALVAGR